MYDCKWSILLEKNEEIVDASCVECGVVGALEEGFVGFSAEVDDCVVVVGEWEFCGEAWVGEVEFSVEVRDRGGCSVAIFK